MGPNSQNNQLQGANNRNNPEDISDSYLPNHINTDVIDSSQTEPNSNPKSDNLVDNDNPVHWVAKEYIYRDKNPLWFIIFTVVVFAFISLDVFLIKSYTFSILVVVMAASLIIYSRRPPREINYTLSGKQGLYIGEQLYHFSEFKSFSLLHEDGNDSLILVPIKRFLPAISVFFPRDAGEAIVDILGARLPMGQSKLDMIDIIARKLRI